MSWKGMMVLDIIASGSVIGIVFVPSTRDLELFAPLWAFRNLCMGKTAQ